MKCTLTYGGLVNAKERLSGVNAVGGCFPEGGDSIQSVFTCERSCRTTNMISEDVYVLYGVSIMT